MGKLTRDMTQGNVASNLILFSIPLCLSYFLQALYGSADTLIVGQFAQLGDVTGVSQGSQVINILTRPFPASVPAVRCSSPGIWEQNGMRICRRRLRRFSPYLRLLRCCLLQ